MSSRRGILPREGFHADVVGTIISKTLLNPLIVFPILALGTWPQHVRRFEARYKDQLRRIKPSVVSDFLSRANVLPRLRLLAIFVLVRLINGWLNRRVLNNGVSDKYDWEKEVVLVTGGSDGIGKEIVLMLARRNVKVVVLDIQPLTYSAPPGVSFGKCDITSTSQITTTAQHIREDVGTPTILVNNAGILRGKNLLEITDDDLQKTFDINTIAHYKLVREFLPSMIENNHGMVVTISSIAAHVAAPRMTEYAASKAASQAFHEGLAAELVAVHNAPKVRTVVVNPSYTRTSLAEGLGVSNKFLNPPLQVETVAEAVVDQILSGQSGQIILPKMLRYTAAHMRSLPSWAQYNTRKNSGYLMKDWIGRQVTQSDQK